MRAIDFERLPKTHSGHSQTTHSYDDSGIQILTSHGPEF